MIIVKFGDFTCLVTGTQHTRTSHEDLGEHWIGRFLNVHLITLRHNILLGISLIMWVTYLRRFDWFLTIEIKKNCLVHKDKSVY